MDGFICIIMEEYSEEGFGFPKIDEALDFAEALSAKGKNSTLFGLGPDGAKYRMAPLFRFSAVVDGVIQVYDILHDKHIAKKLKD